MQPERWFKKLSFWLRLLLRRRELDQDLDDEIGYHLEAKTDENMAKGMTPQEARRAAKIELGGIEQTKERVRAIRLGGWLESFVQDSRFALRMLGKNPGFTAVAVLTLALGIGATTMMFSVLDAVLLRPLPFESPSRLVHLTGRFAMGDQAGISPPDYIDYRAMNRTFEQMAVLSYFVTKANLSTASRPEQVRSAVSSWNLFEALGIRPILGRSFTPADEQTVLPQVVLLGNATWRTYFGADANIVGKSVDLDGRSLTVVGVLPSDPSALSPAGIWIPAPLLNKGMNIRMAHFLVGVGKLKPGVTLEQAQADLDSDAAVIDARFPDTNKGWGIKVRPLASALIGPQQPRVMLIFGAVNVLLLIACANVANLLLARGEKRQRELAVREALGAPRGRIIQQVLTESVVLGCIGGIVGLAVATCGVGALRSAAPSDLPGLNEIRVSGAGLLFTAGVSIFSAVLFGLVPALRFSRIRSEEVLQQAGRNVLSGPRMLGSTLVVGQIALSVALLSVGGLLAESLWRLLHVNPGFQPQDVVTAQLDLPQSIYGTSSKIGEFMQQFEERVVALPGVQAAGAVSELPLTGEMGDNPFHIEGRTYGPSEFEDAQFRQVTPGYFAAMGIPLFAGRSITWSDRAHAPLVAMVDEAFAKQYFPQENAIGKRIQFVGPGSARALTTIVGIVGSVSQSALDAPQRPQMYVPVAQNSYGNLSVVVRTSVSPGNTATALQTIVAALDKNQALSKVRTMEEVISGSVSQPRFSALLVGLFAVLALVLALVGLYGIVAYSVSQKTNEIGIRMALGATPREIVAMVLRSGMKLALAGTAVGLALSLSLGRLMQGFLFGVRASDVTTLAAVSAVLLTVALLACYGPARRAMRVDPMVALRYE